jgi:hypothetical protein
MEKRRSALSNKLKQKIMKRLFKDGIVTTMMGLTILTIAVSLYISKHHTETEAGAVAALGLLLLRSKDSLIGLNRK